MEKNGIKAGNRKEKIAYSIVAIALFLILLWTFFPGDREYQRIPYDVVFLGDSVYGLCRDETSIAAKLQEKTGLKCYNGGLGGTVLGRADAERRLGIYQGFSVCGRTGEIFCGKGFRCAEDDTDPGSCNRLF